VRYKDLIINNITFFFLLYFSLVIGFLYGENLNYGPYIDWISNKKIIEDFSSNFIHTFLNYNDYGHRHSPVYLIFLSFFLDLEFNIDQVRFIHLHFCILLILVFYRCLKVKFETVNNNYLIALSFIIFLSPTFRSLSIWPDSRIPGLTFFVLTIYFFLIFQKKSKTKYMWYTCISLVISSYISPNFAFFFPYFFFFFLKKIKLTNLILLIMFNFMATLPIIYYIFILDVNFISAGRTPNLVDEYTNYNFNLSNKLMIISSIFFFHLSPILIVGNFFKNFKNFILKRFIILITLSICLIYFFNYQLNYTGGGLFFIISNLFFGNNYFFYMGSFFFLAFFLYFGSLNLNNFFLLTFLVASNVQSTIYHKYYEPFVLILFFTLINHLEIIKFFKSKCNILYLYLFSFIFICMKIIKIKYFV